MRFFCHPKIILFFASIFSRKNAENRGCWSPKTLPKSIQNAFKIDVPTNIRFFSDFCSKKPLSQERRPLIFAGRAIVLLAFHTIQCFTFGMHFRSKKPTENLCKTKLELLKIDTENVLVFYIDFFASWPRFWSLLGLQHGAKLAILASENCGVCPWRPS